ncbi:hypothetical protein COX86_02260 [Candidatus Micrarchaeota archaeon CG_4_10_14_0_2_um_filter_60_11]|nr:MAG: hypothetical protein AUJ16_02810 [Candidatus Micrarchaeota archaeon CG1_02_60_51]PIN96324.1 MAG: hypothetical protein COU39_01965 [Candidatus Micrarchaeota archaeon CG10_big_fil_rev_8_21_14_0_10_60_32]PIY91183.1 MAG: hypothetical protein COY71_04540 [Candidatus Micrarchaeota archaeon CG_4_10_14_0_8_um_filter_60_7]PIZ90943.1 MAG: hypothetical protein COX86_02260 [Candidatus Micrarchaeota archaeon CG_4_10_14_0_2_um_filter_60_11]
MKALLAFLAVCSLVAGAQHLAVELDYSNGSLSCVSAQLASGYPEDYRLHSSAGDYSYALLAENNSVLDSFPFGAPMVFYDDFSANSTGGSSAELEGPFELRAKSLDGAAAVKISEGNRTVCLLSLAAPSVPQMQATASPSASPSPSSSPQPSPAQPTGSNQGFFWAAVLLAALAAGAFIYYSDKRGRR